MMMNTNAIDKNFSKSPSSGGASYRKGTKALQLMLPPLTLRVAESSPNGLSRKQAIGKVKRWLQKPRLSPVIERKAKGLMYLFRLEAEDLLEAGVSYENVCALQRHWLI